MAIFTTNGITVSKSTTTDPQPPYGLDSDSSGNLYVVITGATREIWKYDVNGVFVSVFASGFASDLFDITVAADNTMYVSASSAIYHLDVTGAITDTWTPTKIVGSTYGWLQLGADQQTLYYSDRTAGSTTDTIYRWDVLGAIQLADFITDFVDTGGNSRTGELTKMRELPDGTLLIGGAGSHDEFDPQTSSVEEYGDILQIDNTGTVLARYYTLLSPGFGSPWFLTGPATAWDGIALLNDGTGFWAIDGPTLMASRFTFGTTQSVQELNLGAEAGEDPSSPFLFPSQVVVRNGTLEDEIYNVTLIGAN